MAAVSTLYGDYRIAGNLTVTGDLLPSIDRDKLTLETGDYIIPWEHFRVWDAVNVPLPSEGTSLPEVCVTHASMFYGPSSVDVPFFVAGRAFRVVSIIGRVEVAGTDGGAVTAVVKKSASGTAITSGTALHQSTFNLKGTAATNQTLTLSATSSDDDIASGTCIGVDFTGTLTSATGCLTVTLAPAASPDDLRLVGGTFGTGVPSIQTPDLKAAGASSRKTRFQFRLPPEYQAGEEVVVRLYSGMVTHIADTSATVDVEAYLSNDDGTKTGSDLCTTSAQIINSLTFANFDFTITPTSLAAGDVLDVLVTIAVNDGANSSAVIGCIGKASVRLGIRG